MKNAVLFLFCMLFFAFGSLSMASADDITMKDLFKKFREVSKPFPYAIKAVNFQEFQEWKEKYFPALVNRLVSKGVSKQEATNAVLKNRIDEYEKLDTSSKNEELFGVPVMFDMVEDKIAQTLNVKISDLISRKFGATVFGAHADVELIFSNSTFLFSANKKDADYFRNMFDNLEKPKLSFLPSNEIYGEQSFKTSPVRKLIGLKYVINGDKEFYNAFVDLCSSKYKNFWSGDVLNTYGISGIVFNTMEKNTRFFETEERFLNLKFIPGNHSQIIYTVYDKNFVCNAITEKTICDRIMLPHSFQKRLGTFEIGEDMRTVLGKVSGNKVILRRICDGITKAFVEHGHFTLSLTFCFYKLVAVSITGNDEKVKNYFDEMKLDLTSIYKPATQNKDLAEYLKGYELDGCFDTGSNYAALYFEPEIGFTLDVIAKRFLEEYIDIQKAEAKPKKKTSDDLEEDEYFFCLDKETCGIVTSIEQINSNFYKVNMKTTRDEDFFQISYVPECPIHRDSNGFYSYEMKEVGPFEIKDSKGKIYKGNKVMHNCIAPG